MCFGSFIIAILTKRCLSTVCMRFTAVCLASIYSVCFKNFLSPSDATHSIQSTSSKLHSIKTAHNHEPYSNSRSHLIPRYSGLNHFSSISDESYTDGGKHEDISKVNPGFHASIAY